jgi:hypothetical protein
MKMVRVEFGIEEFLSHIRFFGVDVVIFVAVFGQTKVTDLDDVVISE